MAGNKYISDSSNPFFSVENEDVVDDDTFLRHSQQGSAGYMLPDSVTPEQSDMQIKRQQLLDERRRIEQRTVQSSNRSVGLLHESEQIGIVTAEELMKQREQLQNTEQRLDEINSTLRTSQKHIQNIKSVFTSLRSYFGSKNSSTESPKAITVGVDHPPSVLRNTVDMTQESAAEQPLGDHPGLRTRGITYDGIEHDQLASSDVDAQLNTNLDDMCVGLTRLKGLALGMQDEIGDQNQMVERITGKTENVDWKIEKQNKEMRRIMKR